MEGQMGWYENWRNSEYADEFRYRLPFLVHQACREHRLPVPEGIVLRWDNYRQITDYSAWLAVVDDLGIDQFSELHFCQSLHEVEWDAREKLPRLWLAGEAAITIGNRALEKVAIQRRELEAANNAARALVVGTRFDEAVITRGGPDAVAAAGAYWMERPDNKEDLAWRDTSVVTALLSDWFDAVRPGPDDNQPTANAQRQCT